MIVEDLIKKLKQFDGKKEVMFWQELLSDNYQVVDVELEEIKGVDEKDWDVFIII